MGLAAGAAAAGCAVAVLLAGAVLFSRGLLGGDVKLLAAATLWAGPTGTLTLLILTGLCGGLLCLFALTPLGQIASGQAILDQGGADYKRPAVVPYGVAIAAAAFIVTIPPNFS